MHRVLPSFFGNSASARRIQFHWDHLGDSGAVVTPFMQVGTYPTRNFATLGPSELRPPFTGPSIESFLWLLIRDQHQGYPSLLVTSTGQASDPIHDITILLSPVFLINSRHPLFCATPFDRGPPYPEVTESICRVPSTWLSLSPWFAKPVHQCRFRYGLFSQVLSWRLWNNENIQSLNLPRRSLVDNTLCSGSVSFTIELAGLLMHS